MDFTRLDETTGAFFSWFGNHQLFGISGDVYAHLVVGFILAVLTLQWRAWDPLKGMLLVLILSVGKELIFDQHALNYNHFYNEAPKDIFFSWIGFGLGWAACAIRRTAGESKCGKTD